jgi:hypothetical protein
MGIFGRFRPGGGDPGVLARGDASGLMGSMSRPPHMRPPTPTGRPLQTALGGRLSDQPGYADAVAQKTAGANARTAYMDNQAKIGDMEQARVGMMARSATAPGPSSTLDDWSSTVARRSGWSY